MTNPLLIPFRLALLLVLALLGAGCAQSPRQPTVDIAGFPANLVMEEFMIPGADPDVQLYVRNKRPRTMTSFKPDNIVLFVHGATYPAETSFDLQLEGLSWMDYIAARGYDVYLVDVRGYGKSSRPPEMD
jgi:pimeloyl-ACP methyl ester carboxylesterase